MRKESEDITRFNCTICRENKLYVAVGICNHTRICNYCSLKSRMFYDDYKCPICNTILLTLFVIPITERNNVSYEYLETQTECFFKDDDYESTGVYYQESGAMEESIKLKGCICPVNTCISEPFENLNELKKHLEHQHKKYYCDICLREGKRFLSEQLIYTYQELRSHNEYGNFEKGYFKLPPHPECPFCKDMLFDEEQLYKHINQYHFICEICRKGKQIICYSALPNLIDHYKIKHYCCPYKICVDNLYVVFEKESELVSHFISKHNMISGSTQLNQLAQENRPTTINNPEDWNIALSKDEFNFTLSVEKLTAKAIQHNQMKKTMMEYQGKNNQVEVDIEENQSNINHPWQTKKREKTKKNNYHNNNNINEYAKFSQQEQKEPNIQTKLLFDYSFILEFYINFIKTFLIEKIKTENIYESEFILKKEVIYQLLVIIDKLENEDILQLPYLQNFGIEMETAKQMSHLLLHGENINEDEFKVLLIKLSVKQILILYKYLSIAFKKVNKLFFKLEVEQIEEDLYEDFIQRKTNKFQNNNSKQYYIKKKYQKQFKANWDENFEPKLSHIFNKSNQPINTRQEETKSAMINQGISKAGIKNVPLMSVHTQPIEQKKKSKLAMLLDHSNSSIHTKPNKKCKGGNFKLSNFNLDEDFPVLK